MFKLIACLISLFAVSFSCLATPVGGSGLFKEDASADSSAEAWRRNLNTEYKWGYGVTDQTAFEHAVTRAQQSCVEELKVLDQKSVGALGCDPTQARNQYERDGYQCLIRYQCIVTQN